MIGMRRGVSWRMWRRELSEVRCLTSYLSCIVLLFMVSMGGSHELGGTAVSLTRYF